MDISLLIAQVYSLALVVIGLSLVIRARDWVAFAQDLKLKKSGTVGLGLAILPFGLVMVMAHSIWAMSPIVIITIMGWILLIDAVLLMVLPNMYRILDLSDNFIRKACYIKGVVLSLLGLFLSCYLLWM